MSEATPDLETFEEGGSITAQKMLAAADRINPPKKDDALLSPYRDDPAS
jgi:hypothetical protein